MKKTLIYLVFLFSFVSILGQNKIVKEIYIGTSHGVNFNSVRFDPREEMKLLPGYSGGIHIIYKAQKVVGVKMEFNYAQKGWELSLDSGKMYKRTVDYFEIPFTTHVMLGEKRSKYFLDLGPYLGYQLKEKEEFNLDSLEMDFVGEPMHRNYDFGFTVGAGYQYKTSIGNFGIEARYSLGLSSLFIPSEEFQYFRSENQSLTFRFVYTVKIF